MLGGLLLERGKLRLEGLVHLLCVVLEGGSMVGLERLEFLGEVSLFGGESDVQSLDLFVEFVDFGISDLWAIRIFLK